MSRDYSLKHILASIFFTANQALEVSIIESESNKKRIYSVAVPCQK